MSSEGYNGNPNLPKANTKYNWTKKQIEEYARCKADPVYFAETYFKIVHVDKGIIPFKLYDFQREAVETFKTTRKLVINASRQVGKTSIATVIILHFALFNDSKKIALLANKAEMAQEILSRIQLAYEYLPTWLKCGVAEWNKRRVEFDNGSIILAAASSASSIRGNSVAMLYIDEMAFIENWEEFSASVLPTMSSGDETKMIFTSTPNGLNHFFYYCDGAQKNTNGFKYIEVPWFLVPGRTEKWKEEILGTINHDLQKFDVEYCCQFSGSSGTLLSGACLKTLLPATPISVMPGYGCNIYIEPTKGRRYFVIVDVSRGKGLDYSAFQVIDTTTVPYRQVCTFRNNMITPTDYTGFVFRMAKYYNEAFVLVEINDIGGQVADMLYDEFEYENVLSTESHGRAGKRVSGGFGKSVDRGIRTTKTVKSIGCSMIKLLIEQKKLEIYDKETIHELNTFSAKGKSYEAEPGKHDDLVMGLVLFGWLSQDVFFNEINDDNILQHLRDRTAEEMDEDMMPFGIWSDAADDYETGNLVHMDDGWWTHQSF